MRKTPIGRKTPLGNASRRSPLRKGNGLRPTGEGKKKREARTRKLRQSPHTKAIRLERLALCRGQCEMLVMDVVSTRRCPVIHDEPDPLHMHHVHYQRLGHELIDDVRMFCKRHHEFIERTQFPHRKRA